eukprot:CAMPEP_0174932034 /NCGR_PEP_ID=MMETSP1355-20121228/35491_1 /TAXON_ID=464990 /ORGANISM="Hemiselmis tepida, Strain CCMP443" /LENGTH=171 /DNA_ID=CAMNT_0016178431 /DNA_START=16 /DNA_END=527 /DNA_ORIENTATION=-
MEGEMEPPAAEVEAGGGEKTVHEAFESFVVEAKEMKELLSTLAETPDGQARINSILDKYQEQSQLLDPHLEEMVTKLMGIVRAAGNDSLHDSKGALRRASSVLYTVTKVRGFKTVVKFMPHEVQDLEPCLKLLDAQDPADHETWETRYALLLWLSILVMVPFSLSTIDSVL